MSLLDIVRTGIKIADQQTKSLQATVTFERKLADTAYGPSGFGSPVKMRAIVDWKQKQVRTPEGVLSVTRASVLFLDVAEVAKATGNEGISDQDKITLPDGTTGPILDMSGFIDAGTGQPVATEVYLG